MKKILSMMMTGMMVMASLVTFADTTLTAPLPETSSTPAASPFELKQEGDLFTIILEENVTTGYSWTYKINDMNHVSFISDNQIASSTKALGAAGSHEFAFKVNEKGVSTLTFSYRRPWESDMGETLEILVYKTEETVIIEENKMVHALDSTVPTLYNTHDVYYKDERIKFDVGAQMIDGVMMIPLKQTLDQLGFDVTWVAKTKTVEIKKGTELTSIKIGENAYYKNKMAPSPLSAAPVIIKGRTLVPAEFFNVILSKSVLVEEGKLKLNDFESVIHSGFVKAISSDDKGTMTITLTNDLASEDVTIQTIIQTLNGYTYYNKTFVVGDYIHVISPMMMTMSMPGQTRGYIIY